MAEVRSRTSAQSPTATRNESAQADRMVASATKAQGLSLEQCRTVLQTIAGRAATLNEALIQAQCTGEESTLAALVNVAQALAVHIGSMADSASGSNIIGNADRWNYGPDFAKMGQEVQHV